MDTRKMTVRETIIKKFMDNGYDMLMACEQADSLIKEFTEGQEHQKTWGIMNGKKCIDTITLKKND